MAFEYIDPVTGLRPHEMNIVEWCDWEQRARYEYYTEKRAAKEAGRLHRRDNRVEWTESLLVLFNVRGARHIAERIDQAYYPEAWAKESEA